MTQNPARAPSPNSETRSRPPAVRIDLLRASPAEAVRRRVVDAEIRLHLRQPQDEPLPVEPPHQVAAEQIPRHLLRRPASLTRSVDPEDRFPSMRALLDELREPPRRWPLVVAGSMLVVGFGAGLVFDVGPCVIR